MLYCYQHCVDVRLPGVTEQCNGPLGLCDDDDRGYPQNWRALGSGSLGMRTQLTPLKTRPSTICVTAPSLVILLQRKKKKILHRH